MIKKMKGTHSEPIKHILKENSFAETEKTVANEIASAFSKNSSSDNYKKEFKIYKQISEKKQLNFNSSEDEVYNNDFTIDELQNAINELSDTAPGPDNIHNKIIQNLPKKSQNLLLNIYNHIWNTQTFPESWHSATVIPIPKPGKDHSNPTNYRPIALTNCLCKLMEKIISK